jgi:hypothetical protein
MKFRFLKTIISGLVFIVSSCAYASIITFEVDSVVTSNYTLHADASTYSPAGGVYTEFSIGDIFTTKYSFDSEALTVCSGTSLLVCTFEVGASIEFYGNKNNLGAFNYSSLNTSLNPTFTKDSSPFLSDYFSFNREISQRTGFLTGYNYTNARTSFGGGGVNLSGVVIGENNLGSMLNGISLTSHNSGQGVNISFFNDIFGETGIIGTKVNNAEMLEQPMWSLKALHHHLS